MEVGEVFEHVHVYALSLTCLCVSPFFVQKRLLGLIVCCLLQPGVGYVTLLADLQYFPLKLMLNPHLRVFWLSAFDVSASNSVQMDRHGRKI